MKKKLISLAVAGAMTASMTSQADASICHRAFKPNPNSRDEEWKGKGKRRMPKQG